MQNTPMNMELSTEQWFDLVSYELCFVSAICRDAFFDTKNNKIYFMPRMVYDDMTEGISPDDIDDIAIIVSTDSLEFTAYSAITVIRSVVEQLVNRGDDKLLKKYKPIEEKETAHDEKKDDKKNVQESGMATETNNDSQEEYKSVK